MEKVSLVLVEIKAELIKTGTYPAPIAATL